MAASFLSATGLSEDERKAIRDCLEATGKTGVPTTVSENVLY
jgi:hypothetical protein